MYSRAWEKGCETGGKKKKKEDVGSGKECEHKRVNKMQNESIPIRSAGPYEPAALERQVSVLCLRTNVCQTCRLGARTNDAT